MEELSPRVKKKENEFNQLLKYARQFEAEQIWLIRTQPEKHHTDYHKGILEGIKRIVRLIDRQNEA